MQDSNTGKRHWENRWESGSLSRFTGLEKYLAINRRLDKLYKRHLERGEKKILEIGCARGKQLIYFAKEFGYDVYGVDISEKGVEIAKNNLETAGIQGTILCQDIFQTTLEEKSFDIVYSMGLIEHFENPSDIINVHLRLLKEGGILLISIPNYKKSLSYMLFKIFGKEKELINTHNLSIMDKNVFRDLFAGKNIEVLMLDYFGPVDITSVFGFIKFKILLYPAHLLNQILGYLTFFMPGSAFLSPYLVLVATKVK